MNENKFEQSGQKKFGYENPYSMGNVKLNRVKNNNRGLKIFFISLISIFLVFLFSFMSFTAYYFTKDRGSGEFFPKFQNSEKEKKSLANPNGPELTIEDFPSDRSELTPEEVFKNVSPSVVFITVWDSEFSGSNVSSYGSGVIMSDDGYIITNEHVVGEKMKVKLSDGSEYDGEVVGSDVRTDLAVIKINASGLTPAKFGNSNQLSVGATVLSIGNPFGVKFSDATLTKGIVSAVDRELYQNSITKYIQTDAAINPGSSGGALINAYGQVVGINSDKIASFGYEGMGFAIPITQSKPIVDDLIKKGHVSGRVKLGVKGKAVSAGIGSEYGVNGFYIYSIDDDSDLKNHDVKSGDIITKFGDKEIASADVLYSELQKYKEEDTVNLTIYRPKGRLSQGETFNVDVKLLSDE